MKHTSKVLALVAEHQWEDFAQFGGIRRAGSQEPHLACLKIKLKAIVMQAVHAKDPHDVLM